MRTLLGASFGTDRLTVCVINTSERMLTPWTFYFILYRFFFVMLIFNCNVEVRELVFHYRMVSIQYCYGVTFCHLKIFHVTLYLRKYYLVHPLCRNVCKICLWLLIILLAREWLWLFCDQYKKVKVWNGITQYYNIITFLWNSRNWSN